MLITFATLSHFGKEPSEETYHSFYIAAAVLGGWGYIATLKLRHIASIKHYRHLSNQSTKSAEQRPTAHLSSNSPS